MGYNEQPAPPRLRELVECVWTADGPARDVRVLPDGCMDLIQTNGSLVVAGPDTAAFLTDWQPEPTVGVRFRPGALPRLLGIPAHELRNLRMPMAELRPIALRRGHTPLDVAISLASREPRPETAPWSTRQLAHVRRRLGNGAAAGDVADEIGCSSRTLHRQCAAVFGYGPATLRRVLRFRRAVNLLDDVSPADVAALTGYADQPHLHREVRALAGVPVAQLPRGANRSTQLPSGSATVA